MTFPAHLSSIKTVTTIHGLRSSGSARPARHTGQVGFPIPPPDLSGRRDCNFDLRAKLLFFLLFTELKINNSYCMTSFASISTNRMTGGIMCRCTHTTASFAAEGKLVVWSVLCEAKWVQWLHRCDAEGQSWLAPSRGAVHLWWKRSERCWLHSHSSWC